jgi:hypothetical protein
VNTQRVAEVQAVLEGVSLPATRSQLIAYARGQEPDVVRDLERVPDREYDRLDAVGEALLRVQPLAAREDRVPKPKSGQPPGGPDYLRPFPDDTGRVRHDAPSGNPPQKAIEHASETQKRQAAEQGS